MIRFIEPHERSESILNTRTSVIFFFNSHAIHLLLKKQFKVFVFPLRDVNIGEITDLKGFSFLMMISYQITQ